MRMQDDAQAILPVRKRLNHRGPLSIDVSSAWYFITLRAAEHASWVGSRVPRDRVVTRAVVAKRQANLEPSEKERRG